MTPSLALVSHEIAKIEIDREPPIVHNLYCSKTKGYGHGLSISKHFIGFAPFFGTVFQALVDKGPDTLARYPHLYR
jgi:hypothetical protein